MNYKSSSKVLINYIKDFVDVTLIDNIIDGKDFIEKNKIELSDAICLNNSIIKKIIEFIKEQKKVIKKMIVVFEGFSYNSVGNRNIQLVLYQSILRYMFVNYFNLSPDNIFVFSPQTIKKYVGEKTRDKDKLFMVNNFYSFLENNKEIKSKFFEHIIKNINHYKKITINKKNIIKPFDDLVDCFWVLNCFLNYQNELNKNKSDNKKNNKKVDNG